MLFDIDLDNDLLDLSVKAHNKSKIKVKLRSFCTAKETINEIKRQDMEQRQLFASSVSIKGLIYKRDKELRSKTSTD
jgi:hypothetical protein